MNNRYEIIPGFYIAKTESMRDNYENSISRIQTVINCDNDLNFIGFANQYNNEDIKKNLNAYQVNKITEYFIKSATIIYESLRNNASILVVSKNCKQSAPSIAIAFLMKYGNLPILEAIKILRTKKIDIFDPILVYELSLLRMN
jgi:hypothetical protein